MHHLEAQNEIISSLKVNEGLASILKEHFCHIPKILVSYSLLSYFGCRILPSSSLL